MNQPARFTKNEELANAISHGIGVVMSIIAFVILIVVAIRANNSRYVFSAAVFGITMVVLYLSSTLNHALPKGKWKDFFHNFDQIAIFLLIAGTYTPLSLVGIYGDWGVTMFIFQWLFAVAGIVVKLFLPNRFEKGVNLFFIISYIIMGWMLLFFIFPMFRNISLPGMILILLGGFCYTIGTLFFKLKNLAYAHLIWHLFVIVGTLFHWLAIVKFVLPLT